MKLYEITSQFEKLDAMVPDIDNHEDAEAFTELYAELEGDLSDKVHGLCCVIRNTESSANALDVEIKRLTAKKKSLESKSKRLMDYLEFSLKSANVPSVKTSIFDVVFKKNPPSVNVLDESLIPASFIRTKIETSPDKVAIKDALKSGEHVPGCELIQAEKVVIK
jgi:hypothetical protein